MTEYSGWYGIIGPPGTGKTTFLAAQVRRIVESVGTCVGGGKTPVLVSSLTKAAAAEIGGRDLPLPRGAVGTLHAHAFRALGHPALATGEAVGDFNRNNRNFAISSDEGPRPTSSNDDLDGDVIVESDSLGKPGDKYLSTYDLVRAKKIPLESISAAGETGPFLGNREILARDFLAFVEAYEEWKTSANLIDFTDMIASAIMLPPPLDPDVLVVDEVQDLSSLEWELVQTWAHGRTLFAVGDPWQALYTWRGAHPELFDDLPKDRLKILSRSYRVPKTIVEAALRWMDGKSNVKTEIEYKPRQRDGIDVEGEIDWDFSTTPAKVTALLDRVEDSLASGRTAMIQTTCSYMLPDVLSGLRDRGIPFANPWRSKRGDWNPVSSRGVSTAERFAAFLAPASENRYWTWGELAKWSELVVSKGVLRHGAKAAFAIKAKDRLGDTPAMSIEVASFFEDPSVFDLCTRLREVGMGPLAVDIARDWLIPRLATKTGGKTIAFAAKVLGRYGLAGIREKPKVYVGTCHSFKGAEADDVYLFTELSGAAIDSLRYRNTGSVTDPVGSIARTFYVGMTRAKERLVVLGSSNKGDSVFSVGKEIRIAALGVS